MSKAIPRLVEIRDPFGPNQVAVFSDGSEVRTSESGVTWTERVRQQQEQDASEIADAYDEDSGDA